ncbi:MAG: CvpA family protein [Calditrichia bacterium]
MFNWLDYSLIGFFIFGAVIGMIQGYRWLLFRIGCLILAYFLALFFNSEANNVLSKFFKMESANFLGYVAVFFGTLLITYFIGILVTKTKVGHADSSKIGGVILGIAKNVIFCSIIITYVWLLGTEREREHLNRSIISTKLRTVTTFTIYKLPHRFLDR